MTPGDITLGDTPLTLPRMGRKFTEGEKVISREERTSSGRLVRDVTATKKQFSLSYSLIDGDELDAILTVFLEHAEQELAIYRSPSGVDTYTVLMQPFDRSRVLSVGNGLWGDVKLEFDEV